jgi:hypothetical protein
VNDVCSMHNVLGPLYSHVHGCSAEELNSKSDVFTGFYTTSIAAEAQVGRAMGDVEIEQQTLNTPFLPTSVGDLDLLRLRATTRYEDESRSKTDHEMG